MSNCLPSNSIPGYEDANMTEDRFDRLENKIDRLSEAVVSLARVEERITALYTRTDTLENLHHQNAQKLADLEKQQAVRHKTMGIGERLVWLALGGVVSVAVWLARSGFS